MRKLKVFLICVSLLSVTTLSAEKILVHVDGLVCSFCAYSIEKKLAKNPKVGKVKVNLGDKTVSIDTKKGQTLSDVEIRKEIRNSGYNVRKINR